MNSVDVRAGRMQGLGVSDLSAFIGGCIYVGFDPPVQEPRDLEIVLFEHHHVPVTAYADIRKADEIVIDPGLAQEP